MPKRLSTHTERKEDDNERRRRKQQEDEKQRKRGAEAASLRTTRSQNTKTHLAIQKSKAETHVKQVSLFEFHDQVKCGTILIQSKFNRPCDDWDPLFASTVMGSMFDNTLQTCVIMGCGDSMVEDYFTREVDDLSLIHI